MLITLLISVTTAGWCTRSQTTEEHTMCWRRRTTTTSLTGVLKIALLAQFAESALTE